MGLEKLRSSYFLKREIELPLKTSVCAGAHDVLHTAAGGPVIGVPFPLNAMLPKAPFS